MFRFLQEFPRFLRLLAGFAGVAIPAALVNAGLKYCQKLIQLAFMRRLTHHLHNHYTSNRAYFAASTLRGTITVISPASTPLHPTLLAEAVLSLLRDISRVPFYYGTLVVAPELGAIDVTPSYASLHCIYCHYYYTGEGPTVQMSVMEARGRFPSQLL